MNGLNAGNDSVNRGPNSLSAMLMQRFGADGDAQGVSETRRADGGASFRSLLKDRLAQTGTESVAGRPGRTAAETERPTAGGRTAERSTHQGAAVSASQAGRRRASTVLAHPDKSGSASTETDARDDVGTDGTKASTGKTEMAQADVRTPEGKIKVKVKSPDAGEILSAIVASMLEAIRSSAGETAAEGAETGGMTEEAASAVVAATAENTGGTDAAALLKTLEGLLAQTEASANGTAGSTETDAFVERLTALLQKAGVAAEDLKSLTIKVKTDDGAKLMLKLQSLAAGWRNALAEADEANPVAVAAADAADGVPDAAALTADTEAQAVMTVPETTQDTAQDGAGQDGSGTDGRERNTPTAFAAAVPDAAAQGVKTAQMAQGTGVHVQAAANRGTFGQSVSELAQARQPAAPSPLADPGSAKNVASQVLTRIQTVTGDEKHEMELQLKPESLGKINLRVIEEKGQILAKFTAESQQVKSILESNMQLLKDALEKNGLNVTQLSVSVGQQGSRRNDDETGRDRGAEGAARSGFTGTSGIAGSLEARGTLNASGAGLSTRIREYLYGPDSTISLKA